MNGWTFNPQLYLALPIVVLMVILLQRGKAKGYSARDLSASLVSLGIFGTFLGISVALYFFDAKNIQESVPLLLGGMKTAFGTSVFGMGLAIWVRWQDLENRSSKGLTIGATADDVCTILSSISSSISGESDTTLVNQVRLLRQESKDNHAQMVKAFESFAETLAESNSKALIQALEEVIRDFNAKINEQFGENFKELNSAVGKLLDWQENYKTQLEDSHNALKTAVVALQESERALHTITERAEVFRETAEQLAAILQGYKRSQEDLEAKLNWI
jgi:DNA-binding transcriptional regulator GbsR (MarR family)